MGSFMSLPKESAPQQTNGLDASAYARKLTQLMAKEAELKAVLLHEAGCRSCALAAASSSALGINHS
jgi:hypothetical protein